jgi:YegS/Rv2252/BmrU family lipid kinase
LSVVIFNANAGQKRRAPGTQPPTAESLRETLERHGVAVADVVTSGSEEDAVRAVRHAVGAGTRLILAAGGDGTFAQVANELLGKTDVALGILPLGSVMNVARMLGVPRDIEGAAAAMAQGETRLIDVGVANGVNFYETASVGMNAEMFAAAQTWEEGDLASPLRVIAAAFRYRPARMVVEMDDTTITTRALMVTISNGAYMGLGMTVAPQARLSDGQLDVKVWRHYSKLELLRHLASITFGRRRYSPHSATYRSGRVKIVSRSSLPCRADSHDLGSTPLECHVEKTALRVVVGPDYPNVVAAEN